MNEADFGGDADGPATRDGARRADAKADPDAASDSYYGLPVLNPPVWNEFDVAGYLFLGGLAGASSLLAAGAHRKGLPALERVTRLGAFTSISVSLCALIHDLGRPERFLNMLRVFKATSPMSVGTWVLSLYTPLAAVSAAGVLRPRGDGRITVAAAVGAAGLGPVVASYTAALVANTAVPVWHEAHRELPFVFAASAATAAAGLGMVGAPLAQAGPARRLALIAGAGELIASRIMERRIGAVGDVLRHGRPGRLLRTSRRLTLVGGALATVCARRSRPAAVAAGTMLLGASAATRFGIFEAGMASAHDPRYTVEPQRRRAAAREAGPSV